MVCQVIISPDNSGAVASAFLLPNIHEIRTMINAHITLLAEFGWLVGFACFAFISLAIRGVLQLFPAGRFTSSDQNCYNTGGGCKGVAGAGLRGGCCTGKGKV